MHTRCQDGRVSLTIRRDYKGFERKLLIANLSDSNYVLEIKLIRNHSLNACKICKVRIWTHLVLFWFFQ